MTMTRLHFAPNDEIFLPLCTQEKQKQIISMNNQKKSTINPSKHSMEVVHDLFFYVTIFAQIESFSTIGGIKGSAFKKIVHET